MIITILVFLLVLSVLVLVHEAGHFFVAKKLGIKVEEFGFGFPPRVFGKKFGETVYSLNLLPIGGFVKLYGEDEAGGGSLQVKVPKEKMINDPRSFISRNPWQRAIVVVAGVVMNFLLALVIISYLFAVQGVPVQGNKVLIATVAKNSPAAKAGLVSGDQIVSVDGKIVTDPQNLITYTKRHLGEKVTLVYKTATSAEKSIVLTPRVHYPANEGAMGVAISSNFSIKKYPWYQAPIAGLKETLSETWMIIIGLGQTLNQLIVARSVPQDIAGPIGIAQLTGQFIQIGPNAVLSLISLLSLNLAIMNILPIPALDGGRLFFILIEAIFGRKVHPKYEGYAHAVGMVFLLGLIVLITFHDLVRIFTHQPLIK